MTTAVTPYWWERSPPSEWPRADIPSRCDTVVIGSGYTGLHAALRIARGGRDVVVLEAKRPGDGCSTRNGGQIGDSVKPDLLTLVRRHGATIAREIIAEGRASRAFIEAFVRDEVIECDFRTCGRFEGAAHPRAYAALTRQARDDDEITLVPRARQREAIGSDAYHGGAIFHRVASLDPGRYHAGLLERALAAAVRVIPHTTALSCDERRDRIEVRTDGGTITCRDAVLATNGYSGGASPWHRRRIVPIGSYIIATEALDPSLVETLFPHGRVVADSRRVVYYYRASPDGRRVLFGGRTATREMDLAVATERLRTVMAAVFPALGSVGITHTWSGRVGYTFDSLAHCGVRGRIHYAMGYCGSGVGMASYLGMKAGLRVLGDPAGETALTRPAFPSRPFFDGDPWFLPAAVATYRALDRLGL